MNIHNWITYLESAKEPIPIQTARKLAKDLQAYAQYTPPPFPQDIVAFDRSMGIERRNEK